MAEENKMDIDEVDEKDMKMQEEGSQDILLQSAELRFRFTLLKNQKNLSEANEVFKKLMDIYDKNNMIEFYKAMCNDNNIEIDKNLISKWTKNKNDLLSENDKKKKEAELSEGDMEVHEIELERCQILSKTDSMKNSIQSYLDVKNLTTGKKIDKYLTILRICLAWLDDHEFRVHIPETSKLIEKGGDWDRRNRYNVYVAIHNLRIRKFNISATNFLDSIATFGAYEIFNYSELVKYTIISSVLSLERTEIKKKLIDAPEILQIIDELPIFKSFLNSFYGCNYNEFLRSLIEIMAIFIRSNMYLSIHSNYYLRQIRLRAYKQFLQSYRSVKLLSMANEFGVSVAFLDKELSSFISCGDISCKIDSVNGIVEMNRTDQKNSYYSELMKKGDALLNRIQRLSRIITY